MERQLEQAKQDVLDLTAHVHLADETIRQMEKLVEACRGSWKEADGETFSGGTCPTCGQTLPPEQLNQALERYEADRERRKQEAVSRSQEYKKTLEQTRARREQYIEKSGGGGERGGPPDRRAGAYVPQEPAPVSDMPGYGEERTRLTAAIQAAEQEVSQLAGEERGHPHGDPWEGGRPAPGDPGGGPGAGKSRSPVPRPGAAGGAAGRGQGDGQDPGGHRPADLPVRGVCPVQGAVIEEGVNQKFRLARFRLFQEQVNGGLADCCEPTYEGVPYGSLNNGMRINLGVDVIRTISEHYGLKVPLVVDNAESVTRLAGIDTQVIRLVVSGADQALRVEVSE